MPNPISLILTHEEKDTLLEPLRAAISAAPERQDFPKLYAWIRHQTDSQADTNAADPAKVGLTSRVVAVLTTEALRRQSAEACRAVARCCACGHAHQEAA
ncbi:hypothetical protein [Streptomyces sp. NPDC049555]|uniref:hypothetical protein n=1 Tax=Streptomyces sp. NPDC049555 TaxID=3154930 RepID=UPI00343A0F02